MERVISVTTADRLQAVRKGEDMQGKPTVMIGDVREQLRLLPDNSIHCAVTSPPYYGLRAYDTHPQVWGGDRDCQHSWDEPLPPRHPGQVPQTKWAEVDSVATIQNSSTGQICQSCGAWKGELGAEPTVELYVAHLVEVFRELKRVLRPDGTFWLNIGDSYASGGRKWRDKDKKLQQRGMTTRPQDSPGIKPKDLLGVPWMVAFSLRADGWYLRAENIWYKTAPMPESVTDRTTRAHEQVFILSKGKKYFYDRHAILEPHTSVMTAKHWKDKEYDQSFLAQKQNNGVKGRPKGVAGFTEGGRNARSVWTIGPEPFSGSHFAVFPSEIPRKAILAGTSDFGVCNTCGASYKRITQRSNEFPTVPDSEIDRFGTSKAGVHRKVGGQYQKWLDENPLQTVGWEVTCKCKNSSAIPATVIDPFAGSGTSLAVATVLNRNSIGIDLDERLETWLPERIETTRKRFIKKEYLKQ
jgi:DNA modification methylase